MLSCSHPETPLCGICSLLKQPNESENAYRQRVRAFAGRRDPYRKADLSRLYEVMAADAKKTWGLIELANALGLSHSPVHARLRRAMGAGRVEQTGRGYRLVEVTP